MFKRIALAALSATMGPVVIIAVMGLRLEAQIAPPAADTPTFEPPAGAGVAPGDEPTLVTALQEQLGLKLDPRRANVDVLVIDSVEKPSEN